jgi:phosphoribosylformimino-5-aminoimidazole carboxamide ribotide isomerase
MELIPVLDIRGGKAVSGKSGKREEYTDLETVFASSPDPLEIARSLPLRRLYVADLDAIQRGEPDLPLLEALGREKLLLLDAGIRDREGYERVSRLGIDVILGTETLKGEEALREILEREENAMVSLDIQGGQVLSPFLPPDPREAHGWLERRGVERFLFLDIGRVGTLSGPCFPYLEEIRVEGGVYVGGGIRKEDLPRLEELGVEGALVGTALHKGLIPI